MFGCQVLQWLNGERECFYNCTVGRYKQWSVICMKSHVSRSRKPPDHWTLIFVPMAIHMMFWKKTLPQNIFFLPILPFCMFPYRIQYSSRMLTTISDFPMSLLCCRDVAHCLSRHFYSRKHFNFSLCVLHNSQDFRNVNPLKIFVPIVLIGSRVIKTELKLKDERQKLNTILFSMFYFILLF